MYSRCIPPHKNSGPQIGIASTLLSYLKVELSPPCLCQGSVAFHKPLAIVLEYSLTPWPSTLSSDGGSMHCPRCFFLQLVHLGFFRGVLRDFVCRFV